MIRLPPRSALFPNTTLSRSARKVRAIYVNYACHCVTLSFNKISGDWAGFAQELLQQEYPGAVALVSVGCGDRKSTRLNSSHSQISYAVFCLKKKQADDSCSL